MPMIVETIISNIVLSNLVDKNEQKVKNDHGCSSSDRGLRQLLSPPQYPDPRNHQVSRDDHRSDDVEPVCGGRGGGDRDDDQRDRDAGVDEGFGAIEAGLGGEDRVGVLTIEFSIAEKEPCVGYYAEDRDDEPRDHVAFFNGREKERDQ